MNRARSKVGALTVWMIGVTAALAALVVLGADRPGAPPLAQPSEWGRWAADREPLDIAAAGARLIAIAAFGYLLLATITQLALEARGRRQDRPSRCLGRGAPRFVCALTAAAVASTSAAGASGSATGPASPRGPAQHTGGATSAAVQPGMGATMQLVTPGEETSLPWAEDLVPAEPDDGNEVAGTTEEPAAAPADDEPTGRAGGEWVVRPGDHLWSIAEEVLAERDGTAPSDADVRELWVRLIDANRDRLVDPEDPDLIVPGQRLVLPD